MQTFRGFWVKTIVAFSVIGAGVAVPAAQASATQAAKTQCATITVNASPSSVSLGSAVTVSGSLTNCSRATETVVVQGQAVGPANTACAGPFQYARQVKLSRGQTVSDSVTQSPPCAGSYTIGVKALTLSNVVLSSATTSFTVT
jgi:hypothetical protein